MNVDINEIPVNYQANDVEKEIYEMQVKAIIQSALEVKRKENITIV